MKRINVILYEFTDRKPFQIRVQDYYFFVRKAIVMNSFLNERITILCTF